MRDDELVSVYETHDAGDAEIAKLALESEGIAAFVEGERQAGLTGILDVHVVVKTADAERARELIATHTAQAMSDDELTQAELEYEEQTGDHGEE
ncbi:MAG TPA: DUF2007 domain-containing protein [Pirellulales bacterium]|nr:DUF2007 domain-containing protein [Pirellulales bacterium]